MLKKLPKTVREKMNISRVSTISIIQSLKKFP